MGHRKYSAPRRGSIAFRPRARAKSLEARIRNWTQYADTKPSIAGFAGFKVGMLNVMTIDDREKTPNFGKQLTNPSTLLATPPITVIGVRGYGIGSDGRRTLFDLFSEGRIKNQNKKARQRNSNESEAETEINLADVKSLALLVSISPSEAGLSQKRPYTFEVLITGGDAKNKLELAKSIMGKKIRVADIFRTGQSVDVGAITRGKGVEGPITRFGVKKKQHKSRKSVRAVGTLGPISPAVVMYTVARQGQRGFHQRIEYNKRILIIGNASDGGLEINPKGGFKHFGLLKGDYVVVRGSIPGVPKRLVKLRNPIRERSVKNVEPKIVEVVV